MRGNFNCLCTYASFQNPKQGKTGQIAVPISR